MSTQTYSIGDDWSADATMAKSEGHPLSASRSPYGPYLLDGVGYLLGGLGLPALSTTFGGAATSYWIKGGWSGSVIDVSTVFAGIPIGAGYAVSVSDYGGTDIITNTTAALVTVYYHDQATGPTTSLTAVAGATAGTILVEDQNGSVDYTITDNNGTYTVTGPGGHPLGTAAGILAFDFTVSSGGQSAELWVMPAVTHQKDALNFYVIRGATIGSAIDVASVLSGTTLTSDDTVSIYNSGGADTITNTTAASVTVSYHDTVKSLTTSLTAVAGATSGTILVEDQNGNVDYTVTDNHGTYTVTGPGGHALGTVSGVGTLRFDIEGDSGGLVTIGYVSVRPEVTHGGANGWYWITGAWQASAIDVATVFSGTTLTSTDTVAVNTYGVADTITNTTAAGVTVGYDSTSISPAPYALTAIAGTTAGTILVEDENGNIDYTITDNNGTYTVTDSGGHALGTVSGRVSALAFPTSGPVGGVIQLEVSKGGYDIWSTSIGSVIDVATMFSGTTLTSANAVSIQNRGGADTITNTTAAQVTVDYNCVVANPVTALTAVAGSTAGTTLIEDQSGNVEFTITDHNGTFAVTGPGGRSLGTVSGVADLSFIAQSFSYIPSIDVHVLVTSENYGGSYYWIKGTTLGSAIDVATVFASAIPGSTAQVTIANVGGTDTITNTTSARVVVQYSERHADTTSLTAVAGATAGTTLIEDQSGNVDFTITKNGGTYAVTGDGGQSLGTVSGVHDLLFEVNGRVTEVTLAGVATNAPYASAHDHTGLHHGV